MSKSNILKNEQEIGIHAQIFIYRVPKKNHDAIVQLNKQIKNSLPEHGPIRSEFFYLSNTETLIDFVNIAETVSAKQDEEEVWLEIQSYRDRNHRDDTMANMEKDKNCESLYQQYLSLITPGSRTIIGEFSRIKV
ncbi:MAG TPA: DUF1428 family protein [Nitrososphaeraceae archaeon]|nr:DUF1428 family protein [Nitrososphaeraceae archaeon]